MTKAKTAAAASVPDPDLRKRVHRLGLWGLLANWEKLAGEPWVLELVEHEEEERGRRSLERRLKNAKIGRFKPDFVHAHDAFHLGMQLLGLRVPWVVYMSG